MSRQFLEKSVAEALENIELSSRSASKYKRLAQIFGDYLSLNQSRIGIKSIAASKNYGNRISESTGHDIDVLVLIAARAVDRNALRRALETRALRLVPTILIRRTGKQWILDCQYVPQALDPLISDLDMVSISRAPKDEVQSYNANNAEEEVLRLAGKVSEREFHKRLESLTHSFSSLIVKRVGDGKNIKNRLREALGRRPDHLVLIVPEGLEDSAETTMRAACSWGGNGTFYVGWHANGLAHVRKLEIAPVSLGGVRRFIKDSAEIDLETDGLMIADLNYRKLERVKQLRRFLPLDANAGNLFEEHLIEDQRLQYETKTLAYLRKLIASKQRCVIMLTGNAGHGKTHMCRRLLEYGEGVDNVMARLQRDREGCETWEVPDASLPIRVVKDLSELEPPSGAAKILADLVGQQSSHVVVCANEGRLRDVVSNAPEVLEPILNALNRGLDTGETNPEEDDSVHVINLNFQAAVAGEGGFLKHVLAHFLDNQAAWNVCGKCRAQKDCPIFANRNALTLSRSAEHDNRHAREALMDLVRVAEESGYVLTYRETLMFVAFLITGGLGCQKVEELHRDGRRRSILMKYDLLSLLFDAPLSEDQSDVLGVLRIIKRLDPGRTALRPVDEELHQEMERSGQLGAGVFGEDSVQLKTKRDLDKEVDNYRSLIRGARRRAWLTCSDVDEERLGITRSQRLGLDHHGLFRALQEGPGPAEVVSILRRLVKGLHTIQGAVNVDSKTSLRLVDPGFGRSGNHSAIIARSIRIKDLELWPESRWWRERKENGSPPILESVEWIDRRVLLVDRREKNVLLSLDLAAFEFVLSAANGIVMREFNGADRRRVLTCLAHHAERGRREASDEIRVLLERGDGTLTVERDGTILLERS